jgi:hypothetical protein
MRAWVYSTQAAAQRAIDAIDAARGPTETVTRIERGVVVATYEQPALTWAHPTRLRDGRWAVIASERLRALEGRELPPQARVPMLADAVDVPDEDIAEEP